MSLPRRQFLTYLGLGTLSLLHNPLHAEPAVFPSPRKKGMPPQFFKPIQPSSEDRLILPDGVRQQVVISWGDDLGSKCPKGNPEKFGFNNDFTCFFPIDSLTGGSSCEEGLLWVNHEYPHGIFLSDYIGTGPKTAAQIQQERLAVGGSIVHLKKDGGNWKVVTGSKYHRRLTANYPKIELTGPTREMVPFGIGTLANCSGGQTPWMTVLTCEENYPDFNNINEEEYGHRWGDVKEEMIDENQYGWIVEIDPFGALPPLKHSSLGRFKHENAAVTVGSKGHLVVYMGDDEVDQHLYKFVSAEKFDPKASRAEQRKVLSAGTLYVAEFGKGVWIPLDLETNPLLKKAGFTSQAEVLFETRKAAKASKATPLDRCEDCELHPLDRSLYVSLTNNSKHGNLYGQIVRLVENNDDPESEGFRYEIFSAGGPTTGLACPDNLAFDKEGNLWVVCDMSSDKMNKGAYKPFGNNGLFVVPTRGDSLGEAFQFASGPNEAELTGPWFTPDQKTLFLSVQHPGEMSKSLKQLTSHWPDGGDSIPKPSVVAISGF
jgi:secreted PhoX family phosphatase